MLFLFFSAKEIELEDFHSVGNNFCITWDTPKVGRSPVSKINWDVLNDFHLFYR